MKRVRLCMVINNLDVGGLEKMVLSLLGRLDRRLFHLHLVCIAGKGAMAGDLDLPPEDVLVLDKRPQKTPGLDVSLDARLFFSIRRFFKERRIQIAHAHNLGPLVYGGVAAHMLSPVTHPVVVYSEHNQIYSASAGQRRRFPYFVRMVDEIFAVSYDLQRTLTGEMRVPARQVRVIHNGINGAKYGLSHETEERGTKLREGLGIGSDEVAVGCAVVLSEQKGMRYLLEAARDVVGREPRVRFVIAGDGPLRAELERRARDEGLEGRVLFLGYRRDVPDLVAALDAYVLPSLWEGLPLALLEAMAAGKPIVCTTVGGNPEIVTSGENGLLVAPRDPRALADAIVRVAQDADLRARARTANVKKFGAQFSLEAMVEGHTRAYLELLERRRGVVSQRPEEHPSVHPHA
jgi:glycosyltransferase involved in cell wall biosynthesis